MQQYLLSHPHSIFYLTLCIVHSLSLSTAFHFHPVQFSCVRSPCNLGRNVTLKNKLPIFFCFVCYLKTIGAAATQFSVYFKGSGTMSRNHSLDICHYYLCSQYRGKVHLFLAFLRRSVSGHFDCFALIPKLK